jgi:hypothetical protein
MSRWRGNNRLAADYGFVGAVAGFVTSLVVFVVFVSLSMWLERGSRTSTGWVSPCLLRLVALLGLTLGLGIGYMIARALFG